MRKKLHHALTKVAIDRLKYVPGGRTKFFDGEGLYIFLTPAGSKIWRYKYRFSSKERTLVIGDWGDVGIAEARRKREDAKRMIDAGRDPSTQKRLELSALGTKAFETFTREWYEQKVAEQQLAKQPWAPEYALDYIRSFGLHVFPEIGRMNVDEIRGEHVAAMLEKMRMPARAEIVRQRLIPVFSRALLKELQSANPAVLAAQAMIKAPKPERMPALTTTVAEVVDLLQQVDASPAYRVHKLACRFLALTATRPGMVSGARWDELKTEGNRLVWTLPAARMKMRKEFTCPLSPAAVEIIEAMRPLSGRGEYIFPSSTDPRVPMPRTAVARLLRETGFAGRHVAHGFRSSFSSLMNEQEQADVVAIEVQLSHIRKGIEGKYNRSLYIARRTVLVDEWADLIAPTLAKPADVRDGRVAPQLSCARAWAA